MSVPSPGGNSDPLIGTVIGEKYLVQEKLGGGGMGKVYKATHTLMNRTVALKVLHRHLVEDPHDSQFLERFKREAQTAASIDHPNAVTIHDFGIHQNSPYLVMQYIEGQNLKDILKSCGALGLPRSLSITLQVCAAIEEAHQHGIIHRDLKPDNIVISRRSDGSERATVLDFGIAKILKSDNDASGLTQTGNIIGTPQYMSPEQVQGKELDPRSDIYSIGVILYQLLSGVVPFEGSSAVSIIMKHISEPPRPFSKFQPALQIPPSLEQVVLKSLKKDPNDRQQSLRELAADIERVAVDLKISVALPTTATATIGIHASSPVDLSSDDMCTEEFRTEELPGNNGVHTATTAASDSSRLLSTVTATAVARVTQLQQRLRESPRRSLLLWGSSSALAALAALLLISAEDEVPAPPAASPLPTAVELEPEPEESDPGQRIFTEPAADDDQVTQEAPEQPVEQAGTGRQPLSESARRLYETAKDYQEREMWPEAIGAYKALIVSAPDAVEGHWGLAGVYLTSRRPLDAVISLKNALKLSPEDPNIYSNLGFAYGQLKRYDEAIEAFSEAIRLNPDDAVAYNNLGYAYFSKGDLTKAKVQFAECVRRDKDYARAYHNLAEVYAKEGDWQKVIAFRRKGIELQPDDPRTYYALGRAYERTGDRDQAREAYRQALRLQPGYDKAEEGLARLR